ncbi:MAG: efflux RND transporter periplasmic adaptor subunit [Bradymonadales bacterium]|jgi:RND family efflux transporter MFP subunit
MTKYRAYFVQFSLFILLIGVGSYAAWYFLHDQRTAPTRERLDTGVLVEVQSFHFDEHELSLEATGTASASKLMDLRPELSGRVVWTHPQWFPGGRVKSGDVLLRISPKDYELALSNAKITLRQREIALVLERARGRAAENELKILAKSFEHSELTQEESALVKREPQLQEALANIEAAKNSVSLAQRQVERSAVKAPFDAIIEKNNVNVGDIVGTQTALASLAATDAYWVRVSVYPSQLDWLGIPKVNAEVGSEAEIIYEIGEKTVKRRGQIHSLMGSVDKLGRMLQILIQVEDPLGEPKEYPLLIGSFVRVQLKAIKAVKAIALPRALIREGNKVHVCNNENRLEIRDIEIVYKNKDFAYVTSGIESGEKIVSTLMTAPVDGRKLRIVGEEGRPGRKGRGNKARQ